MNFVIRLHMTTDGIKSAHVEQDLFIPPGAMRLPTKSVGIRVDK